MGYDAIDVPAATAQGIVIAYTPGLTDEAVADYTFALLLALEGWPLVRSARMKVHGCSL